MPETVQKDGLELNEPNIRVDMVKKKLGSLKINKFPRPDLLHPEFLKGLSEVLLKPLAIIFQNSDSSGKVPAEWKCANITALFKKGDIMKTIAH